MLKLQSQTAWKDFKVAAIAKAGLSPGSAVLFFWEGCLIEESDEKSLCLIAKDGDTIVLVPDLKPEAQEEENVAPITSASNHEKTAHEAVSESTPELPAEQQDHGAPSEALPKIKRALTTSTMEEMSEPLCYPRSKRQDRTAKMTFPDPSHDGSHDQALLNSNMSIDSEGGWGLQTKMYVGHVFTCVSWQ